jgi:hypothetical protein
MDVLLIAFRLRNLGISFGAVPLALRALKLGSHSINYIAQDRDYAWVRAFADLGNIDVGHGFLSG